MRKQGSRPGVRVATTGVLAAMLSAATTFAAEQPAAKPAAASAAGDVFTTRIGPLLQNRCGACHGETVQKGDLALHTPAAIAKGGEGGPALVAGKPAESEIVRRLRLPLDETRHMPPRNKPQLTEEEIRAIETWIESGAVYGSGAAAGTQPVQAAEPPDDTPPANPAALAALREHLAHVESRAAGSNRLWVDFSAIAARTDDATARRLLEPLLPQLDAVNLARCPVGDETGKLLAGAPRLRRLDLRGTKITVEAVASLAKLPQLRELILAQTTLGDAAVEHLAAMNSLQRVHVWKSGLSPDGIASLRSRRPKLRIDAGESARATALEVEPPIKLSSDAPLPGQAPVNPALQPVNTACPVSGSPVDPRYAIVHKGRVIGFCCPNCPSQFWADPAKFEGKLPPAAAADKTR